MRHSNAHRNGRWLAAEPRFALGDWAKLVNSLARVMIAETCQVAFTNRQWEAYQFVLKFHRMRYRAPSAEELGRGLGVPAAEAAKLISSLTAKGVLERRVYHVLAVVPPSYHHQELAEV